ncbi:addiction module protein [Oscillatoria laete-virens NRMC-F 0139]|nr:addiction module protein [Oscillatoria laete-virens]MDL5054645.1 addiction module protein [Oscillatoria laete-virens NRMC-F 0139]
MTLADVKSLPMEEKFMIMEALWEEMRNLYEQSDIPQSHKDLLDLRRARVESGEAKLLDWDAVKSSIGR